MTSFFKETRYKNRKYLNWVKQQPCCVCGRHADDPHHIIGQGGLSGMGLTAPDTHAMPMCREHHNWIHETPSAWHQQWEWALRTLSKAVSEGVV